MSKEKNEKRISGEAYNMKKQTIYIAEIKNRAKGALRAGAHTG